MRHIRVQSAAAHSRNRHRALLPANANAGHNLALIRRQHAHIRHHRSRFYHRQRRGQRIRKHRRNARQKVFDAQTRKMRAGRGQLGGRQINRRKRAQIWATGQQADPRAKTNLGAAGNGHIQIKKHPIIGQNRDVRANRGLRLYRQSVNDHIACKADHSRLRHRCIARQTRIIAPINRPRSCSIGQQRHSSGCKNAVVNRNLRRSLRRSRTAGCRQDIHRIGRHRHIAQARGRIAKCRIQNDRFRA